MRTATKVGLGIVAASDRPGSRLRHLPALVIVLMLAAGSSCTFAQTQTTWKWTIENVDTSARFTSIAVDALGNVHLAYASGNSGYDLKYAFRDATNARWFAMSLEKEYASFATNITVDRDGNPYICLTPREMKYGSWDGKTWHFQTIDPGSGTAEYNCSVAFSADNTPHLTWYQTRGSGNQDFLHIKHAALRDGVWMVSTVDFDRECGKWNSLVVDSDGHPHIAFSVFPPGELKYSVFDGKGWQFSLVDSPSRGSTRSETGMGVRLALRDKADYFMSFYESPGYGGQTRDPGLLKVGHLVDGRWKLEAVDQVFKGSGWAEYVTALAFDRHGFLHVSYEDGGALKHAYWDGERWHVQLLVGSTGEPAIYSAMKIAGDNTIYISYHDAVGNALRVAVGHPVAAESAAAKPSEASANVRDKVN
jgi:hypothetical protein